MPSAGGIQMGLNDNQGNALGYIDPSKSAVSSVGNANPYYQQATDAYYQQAASRLDPQWSQKQSDLESQLENMGLSRGSEAWTREMQNMGQTRNDAYNTAQRESILTGGQEAQRMQGMDIASGDFANKARQQDYQNQLSSQQAMEELGTWNNKAQQQQFDQNLAGANLNNSALKDQQGVAQGWGALKNQIETAKISGDATTNAARAGASAAANSAAASERIAQMNASLDSRRIGNQERQMDWDMTRQAQRDPYELQNLAAGGMGPTYDNNFGGYGMTPPSMGNPNSGSYATGENQAIQQGYQATGSMGGELLNTGVNLMTRPQQPMNSQNTMGTQGNIFSGGGYYG
jgi:hypothetical protein